MTADTNRPRVGFVGLGIMGAPMVRRLLSQGFQVTVWNLEPERAEEVVPHGALWAESPAEVRAASDILAMCVLHAEAVRNCCFGPGGFDKASGGADLIVDFSTVPPDDTRDIAAQMAGAGLAWIDAPVSGGPDPAETGTLTAMLGGTPDDVARAGPLLEALTRTATLLGPLGAGQVAKTLNQAIVGTNYVLMAEVLTLARAAGIDPARLPEALAGGLADSQILQRTYRQMVAAEFDPPKAFARQLAKDMKALGSFVSDQGGDMPLIARAIETYVAYAEDGNALSDAAAISAYYARTRS
ncbi:NAD(P)-dependent oxidoreductase [Salipiger marinus]|uniref:3-hydroxyisobutyrate dehydrogenase n=1 Tax=Salipiger marinus TaxID=555512 RepID=A0A1G8QVA3_9RHOB|nr:NAD(P)-dependent oxidoreductase [Salipiger marinus]SDJ08664.1 3-hydroxyisobutyrate dehydrogenase [Salipiger marinus]